MSVPPETILALLIGLLLHPIPVGSHHGSSQRHSQKRLQEVFRRFSPLVLSHSTLNHGDDCVSPYEEKLRQQIVEELRVIATTTNSRVTSSVQFVDRIKGAIDKMEEFISMNDKELCNYQLALVCDADIRKCVCGPSRVNVTFVFENGKCHYAEGSMCSHHSKTECAGGTRCISIANLDECKSGLCFCQRQYYATTTVETVPTTAEPIIIDDFDDGDEDEEAEENNIPLSSNDIKKEDRDDNEESLYPVKSTKESYIPSNALEGDDDDDDDDDDRRGEEKIIIVKIDEVEKTVNGVGVDEPPSRINENMPTNNWEATTIPTPVATSPAPTHRQELTSSIRRLEQEVESLKTLGFGDECLSVEEESNYSEYRRLSNNLDCVTSENDEKNLTEILKTLELILQSGSKMCNWTQHLQCNKQSKKCGCWTSGDILNEFLDLKFIEENKRCVLPADSKCLSKDHLSFMKSRFTEIHCASQLKCIAEETKAECKSKAETCYCRKSKPTESPKQKKSRARSKTSLASSLSRVIHFSRVNNQYVPFFVFMVFTMLLPEMVLQV